MKDTFKNKKMNDDEMAKIVGGFKENRYLPTKGMDIVCPNPNCRESKINFFQQHPLWDKNTDSVEYHCDKCGTSFVYYDGSPILKQQWIELCNQRNYTYPYI